MRKSKGRRSFNSSPLFFFPVHFQTRRVPVPHSSPRSHLSPTQAPPATHRVPAPHFGRECVRCGIERRLLPPLRRRSSLRRLPRSEVHLHKAYDPSSKGASKLCLRHTSNTLNGVRCSLAYITRNTPLSAADHRERAPPPPPDPTQAYSNAQAYARETRSASKTTKERPLVRQASPTTRARGFASLCKAFIELASSRRALSSAARRSAAAAAAARRSESAGAAVACASDCEVVAAVAAAVAVGLRSGGGAYEPYSPAIRRPPGAEFRPEAPSSSYSSSSPSSSSLLLSSSLS